jgi:hypothetical protein
LRIGEQVLVQPLVIGLPNRHNVAFDLEDNRLIAWGIGDVARQRTSGKSWFWEWAGADFLDRSKSEIPGDFLLEHDGRLVGPSRRGQFVTEVDDWRHLPGGGLQFSLRLVYDLGENSQSTIHVIQTLRPEQSTGGQNGFRRQITVRGVPPTAKLIANLLAGRASQPATDRPTTGSAAVSISLNEPDGVTISNGKVVLSPKGDEPIRLDVLYAASLQPDTFQSVGAASGRIAAQDLDVAHGFPATRLGITDELMPTGLTWRPDGTLVVSSLKGRVWLVSDTDGDGWEDDAKPFSDELAAPYGVAALEEYVDVIAKNALLRLIDDDRDGRVDRTMTLASGWGHTDDYHDWSMGLPRDPEGNYFVSIACQQDKRSAAAAWLRGTVIRLVPRQPTLHDPHAYSIEPISGGHRFPMGIARSRNGDLFVTDNQGNYNPFNELNHVQQGARYGFINELEKPIASELPPLTRPAINIPHPWTRSVNGICFLDDPAGRQRFGPFEGHLIGCEYDTRRLVRMSLQKIGDTYHGAVYPFSSFEGAERLTGPVVCAVSPRGDIYVGEMRDSGWGAGNNRGGIVRLRPDLESLPAGIAEVRTVAGGFEIDFTRPVSQSRAAKSSNYQISSFTRISTPAYGGDDVGRRIEKIESVEISPDGLRSRIRLSELRPGHVYEFHLRSLVDGNERFFPAEAYYSR